MKIMNFGSLNIDHVYRVAEFVRPGETISALEYHRYAGGKGLNQSIALARAGMNVLHAGRIGADGLFLKQLLSRSGADVQSVLVPDGEVSGHAMIQVSSAGENCIVLFGGANRAISGEQISEALSRMESGDFLLLQNEISGMAQIIDLAFEKGLRIFFNPAPMNDSVPTLPLDKIDTFIVNETEGAALAGIPLGSDDETVLSAIRKKFPASNILMTLGAKGALFGGRSGEPSVFSPACKVDAVADTTAAGDTFIGYYLAETASGKTPAEAMAFAARASAICVSRPGAAGSIPCRAEVVSC